MNHNPIEVGSKVLDARVIDQAVLVLVDPDSYLSDPDYRRKRRSGLRAIRNLRAFSFDGTELWQAEMPAEADYYHTIVSLDPLDVYSFSSFRCRIDAQTGKILSKEFLK